MAQLVEGHFHKAKGCRFHSWSGHLPGLWVQSLVGVMFKRQLLFLSPFPSLKINKIFKKAAEREREQEEACQWRHRGDSKVILNAKENSCSR